MENPKTASSNDNIGDVYRAQGDNDKALEYYLKALAIREKVLGTEHPDTATSYNNIGWAYRGKDDFATALDYYNKAYHIRKSKLGEKHPSTKESLECINDVKEAMNSTTHSIKGLFHRLFGRFLKQKASLHDT